MKKKIIWCISIIMLFIVVGGCIHLVPDRPVYSGTGGPGRKIFSDYMLTKKTAEFKNIVKGK